MPPLLEMCGVEKSFPGVRALRGVDLEVAAGEVLALLGENGAGKSTLIKVLGGAHRPDRGSIRMQGKVLDIRSPHDAQRYGIGIIYQEFNLVPALSARENIFLGREETWGGWVRRNQERDAAERLFARLGVPIDPELPCAQLTVAQQQIVEIAKALAFNANVIVMDEPTATLTTQEVRRLFEVIRELKANGIGIVYVSHRLEEIFEIADRALVLRDGECSGGGQVRDLTRQRLIQLMVGREMNEEFPARQATRGVPRFQVKNLCRDEAVRDVSFEVNAGEVLALTGLVGAGRTEVARLIFGADRRDQGQVWLDGRQLAINRPRDAIRCGIALLTEDRKQQGLVLAHSARDNFGLPNLRWLSRATFVKMRRERQAFGDYITSLRIKVAHQEQSAGTLSGGNQQKVVLAKWLAANCEVLIFDEPTRGVDVGAKYEIHQLINDLAARGKCVIMISSELPEVLGMADRILVMHGGRITGEITDVSSATQERIMQLAVR